jgi:hypothetical protein
MPFDGEARVGRSRVSGNIGPDSIQGNHDQNMNLRRSGSLAECISFVDVRKCCRCGSSIISESVGGAILDFCI